LPVPVELLVCPDDAVALTRMSRTADLELLRLYCKPARPGKEAGGPAAEPVAGNPPVRFDEREVETEHGRRLLRHKRGNPEQR
jgi:hypothetical protein